MNRSQHASTDFHDSDLAVSLKSHSNWFSAALRSTPSTARINTTALCKTGLHLPPTEARNLQSLEPWQFPERSSKVVPPGAPASHVRDRPASIDVDRLLTARLNDPPRLPHSIASQGKAARLRAQASPDEQQRPARHAHATVSRSGLLSTPLSTSQVATTQCEARLAGLLAPAFAFLNTPNRSRWQSH